MTNLMTGFALVFQPLTFLLMVFGVGVGVIIGALPGLTASMGIILLLPLVYRLPANVALVMLCGLFCGGMYGGSISAILLKTPGTPSASATLLDGYPLCEQGKAGKALGISTISSFIGGLISTVCLILIAPQLAKVALKFQAADYFSLSIFGLTIMASSSGKKVVKGLIAGCIGLLASCVGIDTIVGVNRLTFNNMYLAGGFTLLPVLIGVFAISEVLSQVQTSKDKSPVSVQAVTNILPTWLDIKAILPSALVGGVLGVFIGIIPGTGGAIACFLAYNIAQKFAKDRHLFGKGALSGVAAPESANNATTGGALIPMLCLGVPGDVVTSVMLGALILIGVRPGPLLFVENVDIVYSIFAGMIIIQFLMLGFGLLSSLHAAHAYHHGIVRGRFVLLEQCPLRCDSRAWIRCPGILPQTLGISGGTAGVGYHPWTYGRGEPQQGTVGIEQQLVRPGPTPDIADIPDPGHHLDRNLRVFGEEKGSLTC